MIVSKLYSPGALPQQKEPALKSSIERELRKISIAIQEVDGKIPVIPPTPDLNNYMRKDDAAPLQVSEAQTQFNDAVSFFDDINIDKAPAATASPLVDFTKAQYVRIPTPVNGQDATTKDYVDAQDALDVHLTGNQTVGGVKTFTASPIVPTPTTATQAVNKQYVDTHPGIATAWVCFNGTNGAILAQYGISTVVRNSAGDYTITFATPMVNANYAWSNGAQQPTTADGQANILASNKTNTALRVVTRRSVALGLLPVPTDFTTVSIIIHGGR